jgi:hypothetical protein
MTPPLRSCDVRKRDAQCQQGMNQRPTLDARTRVNDHPAWLVDDQQVVVFVEDGQRDGFRSQIGRFGFGQTHRHLFVALQQKTGFRHRHPVDLHSAIADKVLTAGARKVRQVVRQESVQSHSCDSVQFNEFAHPDLPPSVGRILRWQRGLPARRRGSVQLVRVCRHPPANESATQRHRKGGR